MTVNWTRVKDWHVARFRDRDLDEVDEESRDVRSYVQRLPTGSKVAINFDGVAWVSSNAISLILHARDAVIGRGGTFVITAPGERMMEALRIAKLEGRLTIRNSTDELD